MSNTQTQKSTRTNAPASADLAQDRTKIPIIKKEVKTPLMRSPLTN
jgi:hypothetical protein